MGATIDQQANPFAFLWRYKWLIATSAVLVGAIAFGVASLQESVYRADGVVLLNDPRSSGVIAEEIGLVLDLKSHVRNQAGVMASLPVAQRAADNLDGGLSAVEIQDATTATPDIDRAAVTVTALMPTPGDAVVLVDAVVVAYDEIVTEQVKSMTDDIIATLETSKAEAEDRIAELDILIADNPDDSTLNARRTAAIDQFVGLDVRIERLSTQAVLYGSGVRLHVAPETSATPIQPLPARNATLGFVLGVLIAGAWAWWRTEQNQVVKNQNEPAHVLGVPLLAAVPEFALVDAEGPAPMVSSPTSAAAEAYQFAVSSLGFALEAVHGRTVLITSASKGDGKTATALNLAIAAAHDGRVPLLIDSDERAQGLTFLAGLEGEHGISNLDGSDNVGESVHQWTLPDGAEIDIVPAGTGVSDNIATYFRSDTFRSAMPHLLKDRDIVIIDSPPVMAAPETTDVAAAADAVVLVVVEGTRLRSLEDARQRITMSGTPIVGYIYNRVKPKMGADSYGYGYGQSYGTSK